MEQGPAFSPHETLQHTSWRFGQSATRPVIRGRSLVVACGHHLAAAAGMRMHALGGNAVDAGVAMVFAQCVLESQSAAFGGEVAILLYEARLKQVVVINGNTCAPEAATLEWFRARGIETMPGDGFLAAGVCSMPDALLLALDRYGRLTLAEVIAPAIELATGGFPMYEGMRSAILRYEARFRSEWPTSANLLLPGGAVPQLGDTWRNPGLARTFERLVEAERRARPHGRNAALAAARDYFYRGPIAREIVAYQHDTEVRDATGMLSHGLLTEADFAAFHARIETPASYRYRDNDVHKCGPWSQGPMLLQALALLEGYNLSGLGHNTGAYIHTVTEATKLAMADRERHYGDPAFADVPLRGLLSPAYAEARRSLIDAWHASGKLRPGDPYPYEGRTAPVCTAELEARPWSDGTTGTRAVDADGNMFSATPSGGEFSASPIIPGLGFCLGTRLQMFWLHNSLHPGALAPRKQPRTTLSPSLVTRAGEPYLAFGTPGGDQQEQWQLQFFLNLIDFGMDIQDAIDAPSFYTDHMPSSFYPRRMAAKSLTVERRLPAATLEDLRRRGHDLTIDDDWGFNYTTAVTYDPTRRLLQGGASSRGERNYAFGW